MKTPVRYLLVPCFILSTSGFVAAAVCTQTLARLWADVTSQVTRCEDILKVRCITPKPPALAYTDLIGPTARRVGVSAALVKSIVRAESAFNPDAVSAKGALGLMQVMPDTAQEMGLDVRQPAQNLEAGTRYLKWLLARYSRTRNAMAKAIAAYNAGPGAVDRHHGIPRYRETRTYVARVLRYYKQYTAESD